MDFVRSRLLLFVCSQALIVAALAGRRAAQGTGSSSVQPVQDPYKNSRDDWREYCLHTPEIAPGSSFNATYDYCTCTEGQEVHFSSDLVQERFESSFGSGQPERMQLLMLGAEWEQLTKGRIHLAGAMAFAKEFNRTMVLPNVGSSGIAMDKSMHPCAYFDTAKIGEHVEWVSQHALLHNMHRIDGNAKAAIFVMGFNVSWVDKYTKERKMSWLGPQMESLASKAEMHFVDQWRDPKRAMKEALEKAKDVDLIVLIKTGDSPFIDKERFEAALQHVEYAPHLVSIAKQAVQQILSFKAHTHGAPKLLAAQLRIEKFLISDGTPLQKCLYEALKSIFEEKKAKGISHIFVAADVSMSGHFYSQSFKYLPTKVKKLGAQAIREVARRLRPATWGMLDAAFANLDSGIQGILDKLVCVYADSFILPPQCAKLSSYSLEIIQRRAALREV